tara:strand:+ start:78 stop:1343 length:1266 start_codon:yes stop_codon:yes gene_type:complete
MSSSKTYHSTMSVSVEKNSGLINVENFNIQNNRVVEIFLELKKILIKENFTHVYLSRIMGKQVIRYTHLYSSDKPIILKQLFSDEDNLLCLFELFLLDNHVQITRIEKILGKDLISRMIKEEILLLSDNNSIGSKISITPFDSHHLINEGHREFEPLHIHQVSRSQNYVYEVFKLLKKNVKEFKNNKILDLCSGSGALGMSVSNLDSEICGIDLNPRAIEIGMLNSEFNQRKTNYLLGNANNGWINEDKFDLIVSNPPFHGLIDSDPLDAKTSRLIVHAGEFGDSSTKSILSNLKKNISENGNSIIIANWLLKDNKLAYPAIDELTQNGTLLLFHDPIVKADTWEGIRTLYWADKLEALPNGFFKKFLKKAHFNQVCFGVVCWLKNKGPGGFHMIENTVERDTNIISNWAKLKIKEIFGSS